MFSLDYYVCFHESTSHKCSGLPGDDPNKQLEINCFIDAVVAFCKLQHLDFIISVKNHFF
jgi:hypothetical protein